MQHQVETDSKSLERQESGMGTAGNQSPNPDSAIYKLNRQWVNFVTSLKLSLLICLRVESFGWHHWCNGHTLGQTPGDSEGQRSLACCSPWGCKELDTTWQLNNRKIMQGSYIILTVLVFMLITGKIDETNWNNLILNWIT